MQTTAEELASEMIDQHAAIEAAYRAVEAEYRAEVEYTMETT